MCMHLLMLSQAFLLCYSKVIVLLSARYHVRYLSGISDGTTTSTLAETSAAVEAQILPCNCSSATDVRISNVVYIYMSNYAN